MKLKSIKISNVLSFEQKDDIDDCQEIVFDKRLNILIGANGSGKSNFLEIINKFFRTALTRRCNFNEQNIEKHKDEPNRFPLAQTLTPQDLYHNLSKNYTSNKEHKEIKVILILENSDYENLSFISDHVIEINELIGKYCSNISGFDKNVKTEKIKSISEFTLTFFDTTHNQFSLKDDFGENCVTRFIFTYFNYFDFIQNIIFLANRFHEKNWKPLNVFVALISSFRNYDKISENYSINRNQFDQWQQIYNRITEESARQTEEKEPIIFEAVKHKLSHRLSEIEFQLDHGLINNKEGKKGLDFLKENNVYQKINKLLEENLSIKLDIDRVPKTQDYIFSFVYKKTGKNVNIFDLSSGEKGIIHFIFSLFGYNMKNGVMIIDEPELHLHPQIQKKYLNIIGQVKNELGIQFILATHSSIFVNPQTIDGVKRFYLDKNNFTKIVSPKISDNERDLVRILDYTNSSKIFFAKKVILLEGDSDEYFFRFYFDKYKELKKGIEIDIEFIYMGGKGHYWYWEKFLNEYKITPYFIGDRDVITQGGSSTTLLSNPNVFVLNLGKLENYIGNVKSNKLENAIDFCKNRYEQWKNDGTNSSKIQELDGIFQKITFL